MFRKRRTTVDGIEMTLAVDHLAPFLLTNLLLAELRAAAPSRVVTVSWEARRLRAIDYEDLHARERFSAARAAAQARLANELFTAELAERLEGTGVTANAVVQRAKLRFRRFTASGADGIIRLAWHPATLPGDGHLLGARAPPAAHLGRSRHPAAPLGRERSPHRPHRADDRLAGRYRPSRPTQTTACGRLTHPTPPR